MKEDETNLYKSPYVLFNPVYVWKCTFTNGGMVLQFTADRKVPNRFHRWMHKVLLGIVWERIGEQEQL